MKIHYSRKMIPATDEFAMQPLSYEKRRFFIFGLVVLLFVFALTGTYTARAEVSYSTSSLAGCASIENFSVSLNCQTCMAQKGTFTYDDDGDSCEVDGGTSTVCTYGAGADGGDLCFLITQTGNVFREAPNGNRPVSISEIPFTHFPPRIKARIKAAEMRKKSQIRRTTPQRKTGVVPSRRLKESDKTPQKKIGTTKPTAPAKMMPLKK